MGGGGKYFFPAFYNNYTIVRNLNPPSHPIIHICSRYLIQNKSDKGASQLAIFPISAKGFFISGKSCHLGHPYYSLLKGNVKINLGKLYPYMYRWKLKGKYDSANLETALKDAGLAINKRNKKLWIVFLYFCISIFWLRFWDWKFKQGGSWFIFGTLKIIIQMMANKK